MKMKQRQGSRQRSPSLHRRLIRGGAGVGQRTYTVLRCCAGFRRPSSLSAAVLASYRAPGELPRPGRTAAKTPVVADNGGRQAHTLSGLSSRSVLFWTCLAGQGPNHGCVPSRWRSRRMTWVSGLRLQPDPNNARYTLDQASGAMRY
jgi:hypothetical protein